MPLIKPRTRRIRIVRHISRLQEPNRDALLAYAKFIGESPDYVLNQLIDTTLAKDRDFLGWRAAQSDQPEPDERRGSEAHLRHEEPDGGTR